MTLMSRLVMALGDARKFSWRRTSSAGISGVRRSVKPGEERSMSAARKSHGRDTTYVDDERPDEHYE